MRSGVAALDAEWQRAQAELHRRCAAKLGAVGMSPAGLAYVRRMKGYPRIPYFAALWVRDPELRRELGVAICTHAIGIKLIDDLMDRDQPIEPWDQILGVYLLQHSTATFGAHARPAEVLRVFDEDYDVIWREQVHEAQRPADSLASWVHYARIKSGRMMMCYASAACLAADAPAALPAARAFAEAFGVLFMIGDDLRDFRQLGEAGGNLVHLVRTGRVDLADAVAAIGHWRETALRALADCPPVHPVADFMAGFADRLVTIAGECVHADVR
ncbi:hypothetical protein GCM10010123_40600 [Pilimelia anulata]|uniref:Uncharacterized protein n=1 Tax=Pilimelia anulata TaxID=53371 RepID=A0A8J3FCK8_9ACTN|nr:hypothetical protein [Pilimelia anulata]GGK06702.1 hypothetical protein GCM10010123_40600 [Pilimelia anulata]